MVPQLQSVQQKARGGNISIQLIAKLESTKFEKLWNPLFAKLENPMLVSTHSDQWNHHHHRDCSRVARLLHLLSLGSDADADVAGRELYCDGGRLHCEKNLSKVKKPLDPRLCFCPGNAERAAEIMQILREWKKTNLVLLRERKGFHGRISQKRSFATIQSIGKGQTGLFWVRVIKVLPRQGSYLS